jgi:HK97 family phage portal protein
MGFWDRFRKNANSASAPVENAHLASRPNALGSADIAELLRGASGPVTLKDAMRNAAVNRCVTLISNGMGQLPLDLIQTDASGTTQEKARDHPVYRILKHRPNNWQTPFVFKRHLQRQALMHGDGFALPIMTGSRVSELIPLDSARMRVEQTKDWSVEYIYQAGNGQAERRWKSGQLFHLMGPSDNGIKGMSMTDYARDVLDLSRQSDKSMLSMMKRGAKPGGMLKLPAGKTLTDEQFNRLRDQFNNDYAGVENEGKWAIGEDGLDAQQFQTSAKEAQSVEFRNQQVEEIARIFGVPRPFLMMDDTSWGSGIEQLGIFFVQYGLAPWFVAWEQAIAMSLLNERERETYYAKFNERALLRGSMKDQGEYIAKLLGSGGSPQVIEQNEARGLIDLPPHKDGTGLSSGMGVSSNAQ